MRNLTIVALLLPIALAACASNSHRVADTSRIDELRRTCEARGGMLVPAARITGYEALDYPCVIHGGANPPTAR